MHHFLPFGKHVGIAIEYKCRKMDQVIKIQCIVALLLIKVFLVDLAGKRIFFVGSEAFIFDHIAQVIRGAFLFGDKS
ncbi:hypothetical protein D3C87_2144780 [compost metagenome]